MISIDAYDEIKETSVHGRYITNEKLLPFFRSKLNSASLEIIGSSVEERPIHCISLGIGSRKILMWSQMHGNESTTTKAVLDVINFLNSDHQKTQSILSQCTIKIIPILNPDGAHAYTRVNLNQIDLNRDAQDRSQPESIILRTLFDAFQPDYCFNLHDQRTIFNVGKSEMPATVSFLAPAFNQERNINTTRQKSMQLIVAMNQQLQKMIPGQVGRYDDAFNANCVGDTFQMQGVPTLLFEAGHYKEDYAREQTRMYIFNAMLTALQTISENKIDQFSTDEYFEIPENQKLYFDVLIRNAHKINATYTHDVGILFKETLVDGKIQFIPHIEKVGDLSNYFGHENYDCNLENMGTALKNSSLWEIL